MIDDPSKKLNIKTYVKGTFLLSQDGFEYKERNKQGKLQEKIVQDRIGFLSLQQQIQKQKSMKQERQKLQQNKKNKASERPALIPIKDTPVEPIPEPVQEYQKCQMATQEQFQFFQNSVYQRDKEKEFQRQQEEEIQRFLEKKEKRALEPPAQAINLVFVKEQTAKEAKPKRIIKKIIKKKEEATEEYQKPSKVRLVSLEEQRDIYPQPQRSEKQQQKQQSQKQKQRQPQQSQQEHAKNQK